MARGKWADIVKQLEMLPPEDGDYQARIDAEKAKITERTSSELARRWRRHRKQEKRLDAILSRLHLMMRAEEQMMLPAFEEEDLDMLRLTDGGSVAIQFEPSAKVTDKYALRDWLEENGYRREMTLPWQTINSILKARLEGGLPEMPGVTAYNRPKFVLRDK